MNWMNYFKCNKYFSFIKIRVTKLADLRTYINEYNIRSEIIGTGMGTDNPEHVALLKQLCLKEGLVKAEETQQEMK